MATSRDSNFVFPFAFPWPRPRDKKSDWKPEAPLLLVPGICGTILNVRKKGQESIGSRAWVAIEYADAAYKNLWGKYNADTQQIDCLNADSEVIIPHRDDNGGLYPVDILDPELYVPLHVVYYYHNMMKQFEKLGYEPGKTLFGFGYDFRLSNPLHVDELLQKLESIRQISGYDRVDVVTHSMGGLVMRSLLALHPDKFESYVRKWVAIAVPFGGAPGFTMDGLLTGVQFAWGWQEYFFVERATMHMAAIQSPAVHELVPPKDFAWKAEEPVVGVWMAGAAGAPPVQERYPCSKLQDIMAKVMEGNKISYGGQTIDWPMNPACWDVADASKRMWHDVKLPSSCQFYNIYGMGKPTPYNVTYGSEKEPLGSYPEVMQRFAHYSYVDGDNCVPVECATADGLDAVERVGIPGDHRGLIELTQVWALVYKWVSDGQKQVDWEDVDKLRNPAPPKSLAAKGAPLLATKGAPLLAPLLAAPPPVFVGSKPAAVPPAEGKVADKAAIAVWTEEEEEASPEDWVVVCVDNVLGGCWK